ncbi:MAG: amidohydrolase family protein [Phycisphaerales bacterium]|nr:amidohydrolase family protein [Phycisphaerales bacterium]
MHLRNLRAWVGDGSWKDALWVSDGLLIDHVEAGRTSPVELDLGGRVVTPGLIDAHVHLVMGAQFRRGIDLSSAHCALDMVELLQRACVDLDDDAWLISHGWDETAWPGSAPPTLEDMSLLGPRPIVCWRCDLHAALVNQTLLDRLELPAGSPAHATGLLVEDEAWEVLMPALPQVSPEEVRSALVDCGPWLNAMGITGLRTMEYRRELESMLDPVADNLNLRLAVTMLDRTLPLDLEWIRSRDVGLPTVIGCKAFFDGTLGSRTARLASPYVDRGGLGRWVELALEDQDEAWRDAVVQAGLAPSVHAIGDAAVGRARRVLESVPDDRRATIEHAELVPEDELAALARLRLSVQPVHRAEDARGAKDMLGEHRAGRLLPLRSLQQAGARLAFGTDWPVTQIDPMRTLRAALTGETIDGVAFHSEEAIDNHSALYAMTLGAAEAVSLPGQGGLISGEVADLVVWEGDPLSWDGLSEAPRPALVIVGGTIVFGDPDALA